MKTWAFSMTATQTYLFLKAIFVSFFVGITLYFHACYRYFEAFVANLDIPTEGNRCDREKHPKNGLLQAIEFYIYAKESVSLICMLNVFILKIFFLLVYLWVQLRCSAYLYSFNFFAVLYLCHQVYFIWIWWELSVAYFLPIYSLLHARFRCLIMLAWIFSLYFLLWVLALWTY